MKTSQRGIDLIKEFEGFVPKRYLCPAGKPTIGYGHVIKPGEELTHVTKSRAEELLRQDLHDAEQSVIAYIDVPLTQNQFDALVSLVFNTGPDPLLKTLGAQINANDPAAAQQFDRWIYAGGRVIPGLVRRRRSEKELFMKAQQ